MFVVTRGVMAAGMAVYAAIHAFQALGGRGGGIWQSTAFALSATVALALGVLLLVSRSKLVEHAAAGLAAGSLAALVLALTTDVLGVAMTSLAPAALVVMVVEVLVLVAWSAERTALQHDAGDPGRPEQDDRSRRDAHAGI